MLNSELKVSVRTKAKTILMENVLIILLFSQTQPTTITSHFSDNPLNSCSFIIYKTKTVIKMHSHVVTCSETHRSPHQHFTSTQSFHHLWTLLILLTQHKKRAERIDFLLESIIYKIKYPFKFPKTFMYFSQCTFIFYVYS